MSNLTVIDRAGGRKFIFAMWVTVAATGLMGFDRISDGIYSGIIIAALGGYLAGNVVQKKVMLASDDVVGPSDKDKP